MKFSDLQEGDSAVIIGYNAAIDTCYRYQLLSMGLTPHTPFKLARKAPLGDPVVINVRGTSLVLRASEADCLKIKKT